MLRRLLLTFLLPLLMTLPVSATGSGAPAYKVPRTTDLKADGQLARRQNLPILIMFSQTGCSYCEQVLEQFLEPMRKSGDYTDKVIMRRIKLDAFEEIKDFDGQWREPDEIALRYRASVTPTVVFVDYRGHELAERILGLTTVDFYGGELDDAIDLALQRLRPVNLSLQPGSDKRLQ
ncbi:thioredoxin family protein [Thiohalophilus sp.]|uniref:thioredoxin family protein n=1 Tax=Thiohalophilus sp. TaxID=3028392 RepID=UPI002ACD590C|nr:thioredoxin fold domain-containing protein [Thiohalophilus sp.]MDZ7803514.1 thioredoxin family protein [Thiohalophilus sp.]